MIISLWEHDHIITIWGRWENPPRICITSGCAVEVSRSRKDISRHVERRKCMWDHWRRIRVRLSPLFIHTRRRAHNGRKQPGLHSDRNSVEGEDFFWEKGVLPCELFLGCLFRTYTTRGGGHFKATNQITHYFHANSAKYIVDSWIILSQLLFSGQFCKIHSMWSILRKAICANLRNIRKETKRSYLVHYRKKKK